MSKHRDGKEKMVIDFVDTVNETTSNNEMPLDATVKGTANENLEPTITNNKTKDDIFTMIRGVISNELYDGIEKTTRLETKIQKISNTQKTKQELTT